MTSRIEPGSPWQFGRSWPTVAAAAMLVLAGVGVLPGTGTDAGASIMIALDLPTLVQQSDHIAVVEVATTTAAWDTRHERIYSTIELKVIENWKAPAAAVGVSTSAPPPAHLTIVQPGGTVGDIRMTVTGMGTFAPGERSLVFLRGPANHAQVVGMTQGKRAMRFEVSSQKWMVTPPDLRQAKLVPPPVGRSIVPRALSSSPSNAPVQSISSAPSSVVPGASAPSSVVPGASAPSSVVPGADMRRELSVDDMRLEIRRLLGASGQ